MKDKSSEQQFVSRIRSALDQSVDQLDPGIRSRLRRMRHEALARKAAPPQRRWRWATGLAAAGAAAAMLLLLPIAPQDANSPLAAVEDLEMLASGDPLEIYEDMEFYSWLSDMENEIENG